MDELKKTGKEEKNPAAEQTGESPVTLSDEELNNVAGGAANIVGFG